MKKRYITPAIVLEELENDRLLLSSKPGNEDYTGGGTGIGGGDNDEEVGSKGGHFTFDEFNAYDDFYGDFAYSVDF